MLIKDVLYNLLCICATCYVNEISNQGESRAASGVTTALPGGITLMSEVLSIT